MSARRPTVAHLTSLHPPFDIRIFVKECRSLAHQGYDVTLVAPHDRNERRDDVYIRGIPRSSRRLARMTVTAFRVYREAARANADIYHFHDPELISFALVLALRGRRVIYDVHEDVPRALMSPGKDYVPAALKPALGWLLERVERFAARRFSACVTATPAIGARFKAMRARVEVINNFPIVGELAPAAGATWANRQNALVYLGNIAASRGSHEMVRAMAGVTKELGARLKLVGAHDSAAARQVLTILPGWEHVDDCGVMGRAEVARLLAHVYAGLVLFHPEPNHVEAQPNKLFEYMSAGIPVIASDFPLWRQLIEGERCGFLVDPLDVAAISRAIEYLLTNPAEAEAMGWRGREAIERCYNWGSEAQKLGELYQEILRS